MTMSIAQACRWMDVGWNERQPEKGRKRFRLGHEMCSEYYERQVSKKEGEFDCGRGAYFANAMQMPVIRAS